MEIPINNKWGFLVVVILLLLDFFANLHSTSKVIEFETKYEKGISESYVVDTIVSAIHETIVKDLEIISERKLRLDSVKKEAMKVYSLIDSLVQNNSLLNKTEEEKAVLVEKALLDLPKYEPN
jgi:hypothetical protein